MGVQLKELIKVENLTFSYPNSDCVLDGLTFSIYEGENVTILGANGCGKSTLIKVLVALFPFDEGSICVDGIKLTKDTIFQIREKIGIVFQNPENQFVSTLLDEDVAFSLKNYGYDEDSIKERVRASINKMRLSGKEKRNPYTLSGGEKQRAALAGVIALRPKILVFDESISMLDQNSKDEFKALLNSLNKEYGYTIISVTHYAEEAVNSDRIFLMDKGKIVKGGKPSQILTDIKTLKNLNLLPPCTTRIALSLIERGIKFKFLPLTPEDFGESICV